MTPFALSLLGVDAINRRRHGDLVDTEVAVSEALPAVPASRASRSARRATSYYNSFQTNCSPATDNPPSYPVAVERPPVRSLNHGSETLPSYSCTVNAEAKMLLLPESVNPLHSVTECEWREVHVVLRGTLLSFHRPKDNGPGKLLRSYTLQHAEIGLASDSQHTILAPQTRLAHLIPCAARRKALQKDPGLFKPVRQHILRLRAETDQLLLADACEERVHSMIYAISAAIDISYSLDERSIPRQCTVPRRRRRQRPTPTGDLANPTLLAEQERILRDMYPGFAEQGRGMNRDMGRPIIALANEMSTEPVQTPGREEDELDLAMIREDSATPSSTSVARFGDDARRPNSSRTVTNSSTFTADMIYATSRANFDSSGKWQPPHTRAPQQTQRYVRRCMPILPADAVRASDVLISNGKRVKINWRMELLEDWELRPPSYKSHGFIDDTSVERARSISQFSTSGSVTQDDAAQASTSVLGGGDDDQITPAETGVSALDLSKVTTNATVDKGSPIEPSTKTTSEVNHANAHVHGIVFCF